MFNIISWEAPNFLSPKDATFLTESHEIRKKEEEIEKKLEKLPTLSCSKPDLKSATVLWNMLFEDYLPRNKNYEYTFESEMPRWSQLIRVH